MYSLHIQKVLSQVKNGKASLENGYGWSSAFDKEIYRLISRQPGRFEVVTIRSTLASPSYSCKILADICLKSIKS
jgi:hypothetical protein